MPNDMNISDAVAAVKQAAKLFLPVVALDAACDRLADVAGVEADLQKRVAKLKGDIASAESDGAAKIAEIAKNVADKAAEHDEWLKTYDIERAKVRAETLAEEKDSAERIAAAKAAPEAFERASSEKIASLSAALSTRLGEIQSAHDANVASLVAERDDLVSHIAELQAKLDEIKSSLSPLMG